MRKRNNRELDLLRSYHRKAKDNKEHTPLLDGYYTPALVLLAVGLVIWGGFAAANFIMQRGNDAIQDWLTAPETIAQYDEATQKQAQLEQIRRQINEVDALENSIATYPKVTSTLMAQVRAVGGDRITIRLTGYDDQTGVLAFEAQGTNVSEIPGYVRDLQDTGLFQTAGYTGYTYDEDHYVLSLSCVLACNAVEGCDQP